MSDLDLITGADSPFDPWVRDAVRELRAERDRLRRRVPETPPRLTVTIDLDGPAIADDPVAEIARMLQTVAQDLGTDSTELGAAVAGDQFAGDRGRNP